MVIALFITGCNNTTISATTDNGTTPAVTNFKLSSPAFADGENIPMLYTCDSTNSSPMLQWNTTFKNTKSFALIMDDPDVPTQPWVHWIVYNIPPTDTILPANLPRDSVLANGIKQGYTSFQITGYGGPCPPSGTHRYYFRLYALDAVLPVPSRLNKAQLLMAMKGHILAETDLMGRYTRIKNSQ